MISYVSGPLRFEKKTLTQRVWVGGKLQFIPFQMEIIWNSQSESTIEYLHGGVKFKEGSTHNDYYGFMTSRDQARQEAEHTAKRLSVSPESSLTLRVVTRVREIPFVRTTQCEPSDLTDATRRHALEYVPDDWYDGDKRLEPIVLQGETITWSIGGQP